MSDWTLHDVLNVAFLIFTSSFYLDHSVIVFTNWEMMIHSKNIKFIATWMKFLAVGQEAGH